MSWSEFAGVWMLFCSIQMTHYGAYAAVPMVEWISYVVSASYFDRKPVKNFFGVVILDPFAVHKIIEAS